jgi:hypothetical protein
MTDKHSHLPWEFDGVDLHVTAADGKNLTQGERIANNKLIATACNSYYDTKTELEELKLKNTGQNYCIGELTKQIKLLEQSHAELLSGLVLARKMLMRPLSTEYKKFFISNIKKIEQAIANAEKVVGDV